MPKTFGQQLRAQREASGTAAADLAAACGVSPTLVSLWESDERTPPHPEAVLRLAGAVPAMTRDAREAERRGGFSIERRLHTVKRLGFLSDRAAELGAIIEALEEDNDALRRLAVRGKFLIGKGVLHDTAGLLAAFDEIEARFNMTRAGLKEHYSADNA